MTREDIERWIVAIHGTAEQRTLDGANQERLVLQYMQENQCDGIKFAALRDIYAHEFTTNPWSVNYDFDACGVGWEDTFHVRPALAVVLDYIFYSPQTIQITAADDTEWMTDMYDRALGGKPDVSARNSACICHVHAYV